MPAPRAERAVVIVGMVLLTTDEGLEEETVRKVY
jgi:hypothetical protein